MATEAAASLKEVDHENEGTRSCPARRSGSPHGDGAAERRGPGKKGKKKKLIIIVGVVVPCSRRGGVLVPRGPGKAAPRRRRRRCAASPSPATTGDVLVIDSVSINLPAATTCAWAWACSSTTIVKETPDTAKALDLAIALFSGQHRSRRSAEPASREALKAELLARARWRPTTVR